MARCSCCLRHAAQGCFLCQTAPYHQAMPLRGLKLPAFAAAVCMGPGLLLSQPQAARPPAFEVASVRLSIQENNHPQGFRNPSTVIRGISGNRFTEHYITL